MNKVFPFLCLLMVVFSCAKKKEGCTSPFATNFDETAEVSDGSCVFAPYEPEVSYAVPACLEPYVMKIQEEGNLRGKNYDFKTTGFIINLVHPDSMLIPGAWGVGYYYSVPPRIDIINFLCGDESDTTYSFFVEELMFHEFGHAGLNRSHTCDTLSDGFATSIMFGGLEADGESGCSYNAPTDYVYRRSYYLDELFQ